MFVLFIIFGILMVMCGFSFFFTPLINFLDLSYFLAIMIVVYGIIGIVKAIAEKRYGVPFAFSILSVIFGIAILVSPYLMTITDAVLIYIAAAWFVLQGFVSVFAAIKLTRATGSKIWILQLIVGILAILLGCYSFFHPALVVVTISYLVGFYFIETGFALIFGSAAIGSLKK